MMGRRRGPGLVGAMARTAVVVGTANAVSNKQQQKHAAQNAANAEQAAPVQEAAPADAPATAPETAPATAPETAPATAPATALAPADDLTTQLVALAKLRDQGILTEEEFSAKKAQILGI